MNLLQIWLDSYPILSAPILTYALPSTVLTSDLASRSGRRFWPDYFLTPVEVEPGTRASGRDFPTDWANLSSTIWGTAPYFPAARVHSRGVCRGNFTFCWGCCRGRVSRAFPTNNCKGSLILHSGLAQTILNKAGAEVLKQAAK